MDELIARILAGIGYDPHDTADPTGVNPLNSRRADSFRQQWTDPMFYDKPSVTRDMNRQAGKPQAAPLVSLEELLRK